MKDKIHVVISIGIWQNSISVYYKNSQSGYRRDISQHNKNQVWQAHS